ncbi:MAG TPA: hypothetical protein VHR45_01095 [Thermoanaerobaculia bacterium]|nr:hypothetical protein [Thermoanaerobaculia bacterium]
MAVLMMDAGLPLLLVGLISLAWPLRWIGIPSRGRAALVASAGAALVAGAVALPAPLLRSARSEWGPTRIDEIVPSYQFAEHHEIRVHAAPGRIFWAIKTVPAQEIFLFRTLTWLRQPRLPGKATAETILSPPAARPLLAVATSSGFMQLAEDPDRELVIGTLVIAPRGHPPIGDGGFATLAAPGYAKAVMNFLVLPEPDGWCRLTTETRVFATDPASRRRFAAYWRIIYPGSALIRIEWLKAIRRRAESPAAGG